MLRPPVLPAMISGQPVFEDALSYWQGLRKGQSLPARSDFRLTASGIDSSLSQLIEVVNDSDWRVRFQGQELMKRAGADTVGLAVFDAVPRHWRNEFIALGGQLRAVPCGSLTEFLKYRDGKVARRVSLSLPLADDNGIVRYIYIVTAFDGIDGEEVTSIETAATADEIRSTAIDIGFGCPFGTVSLGAGKVLPSEQLPAPILDHVQLLTAYSYLERLRPRGQILMASAVNLARLDQLEFDYALIGQNGGQNRIIAISRNIRARAEAGVEARDALLSVNPALKAGISETLRAVSDYGAACAVRLLAGASHQETAYIAFMYPLLDDAEEANIMLMIVLLDRPQRGLETPVAVLRAAIRAEFHPIDLGRGVPFDSKVLSV